jgi:hypothetical protein
MGISVANGRAMAYLAHEELERDPARRPGIHVGG